jgi:hypothetical protein
MERSEMIIENDDGSVSIGVFRFVPMVAMRRDESGNKVFEPLPGLYVLPGGGRAMKSDLPEIARMMKKWMEGRSWT